MWGVALFVVLMMVCVAITFYLYRLRNVPARGHFVVRSR
jgi:hypothetical protein